MTRPVNLLVFCAVLGALLSAQPKTQIKIPPPLITGPLPSSFPPRNFTGRVTDSMCARADHKPMGMGETDAECTRACVLSHGAQYVLFDGKNVYVLGDQRIPEQFAGMKVTVRGVLNAQTGTIEKMSSIKAVK